MTLPYALRRHYMRRKGYFGDVIEDLVTVSPMGRDLFYVGDNPPRREKFFRDRKPHIKPVCRTSAASSLWRAR